MLTYREQRARIASDRAASFFLKSAADTLAKRDPVDALRDAEALVRLAKARLAEVEGLAI